MFNDLLPKFGIEVRFVDAEDPMNFERAMDDKTRAFFCESVSNPALEICDLEAISTSAHEHGLPVICDSTFSTVSIHSCNLHLLLLCHVKLYSTISSLSYYHSPTCASHSSLDVILSCLR